jgi:8-oxo-dGTP diphosphatase
MLKVVCAIIYNSPKILLTQIFSGSRAFKWEFPGGKINPGENAEDAFLREISEELNLEILITESMNSLICNEG